MLDDLLPIFATGIFTLAGFWLSAYIEAKKNKQQLLQIVFKKRIEVYTALVEMTHETLLVALVKNSNQDVMSGGVSILNKFGGCALFASNEVSEVAVTYGTTAANSEIEFEEKKNELASLHGKLRTLCQQEIGMEDLQCELSKNDNGSFLDFKRF
ncbi:hypothetical protein, partial [Pseudodesulfovibrio sp.]|uniref:hypothetical protein n=1 Tax=Pseudodesulfovibrio sp. TaxID=2035812 RepID=UPI002628CF45